MPIGPRGERLPYNGNMNGPPSDLMAAQEFEATRGGVPGGGGQAEVLVQRFLSTASELKQLTDQLAGMGIDANQLLAGEVTTGGGPEGGVGGRPEMPVAANTGAAGGGLLGGMV